MNYQIKFICTSLIFVLGMSCGNKPSSKNIKFPDLNNCEINYDDPEGYGVYFYGLNFGKELDANNLLEFSVDRKIAESDLELELSYKFPDESRLETAKLMTSATGYFPDSRSCLQIVWEKPIKIDTFHITKGILNVVITKVSDTFPWHCASFQFLDVEFQNGENKVHYHEIKGENIRLEGAGG